MSSRRSKRRSRRSDGLPDYVVNRMTRSVREQHIVDLSGDVRSYAEAILDLLASEAGVPVTGQQAGEDVIRQVLQTPEFYELLTGLPVHERGGACLECGAAFTVARRGRPRRYCSRAHRQRAYRRRAGLQAPARENLSRPRKAAVNQWVEEVMEHRYPGRLDEIEQKRGIRVAKLLSRAILTQERRH